jgi:hypothetical protein
MTLTIPIPYPERLALGETPVSWQLGEIPMVTPLMSYARLQEFHRLANHLRLMPPGQTPQSLLVLMERLQDHPEQIQELRQGLRALGRGFRTPDALDTLAALLVAISDPDDLASAADTLRRWSADSGMDLAIPEDPRQAPAAMRNAMRDYAMHTLTVEDCIDVVEALVEVNTRLAKKLRGVGRQGRDHGSPRKAFWSQLLPGASDSAPERPFTTSPGSP